MKKKILSLVLALCMAFGGAAALPQSTFTESTSIKAVAAAPSINTKSVTLYALDDWAKKYISIPSTLNTKYQLKVSNAKNVSYRVSQGESVVVSDSGVVTPHTTTWYWYNGWGTTAEPGEGQTPTRIDVDVDYGKSVITVNADGTTFTVNAEVKDYSDVYANNVMDDYIKKNIKSTMTGVQKLTEIAKFVASYDYSASCSGCTSMIVCKGGDCWASTDTIITMCKKLGIEAWERNGNRDSGAGSGHKNAMAYVDGKYYEIEAGYGGTAPRMYDVTERDSLFSFRYDYNNEGYVVYQYDANTNPETLTVPKEYKGKPVIAVGDYFIQSEKGIKKVVLPSTIKSIGRSAFNSCEDLETINIPASVTKIDQLAFTNLTKLKEITGTNKTFKWANGGLIQNGTKLLAVPNVSSYTIPDTVTEIAPYAFYYNKKIKTLTIPSSVKTIGEGAFGDCDSLQNVYIKGNSLKELGDFAFAYDNELGSVYIPDSVTTIGEYFKNYLGSKFKILCHEGSKIAEYAEKNEIPFELIDKSREHLYSSVVTKKATCTEDGVRKYTCQMCGKSYTEVIPKLGHDYKSKEVKVTCTTDGCTLKTCSRCNKQIKSNIVKAPGHKWSEWKTTKSASCIETGTKQKTCSVCKKTETQTIAKLGHSWNAPVWSWSGTSDAIAKFVCSRCKRIQIMHAAITSAKNNAKCGETGGTVYTAKVTFGGKVYTNSKTVGSGAVLPHKWGAVTYTWSKDNKTCTATRVCQNDKTHKQTETVKTTYKLVKANCTANGTGRYTAAFKNTAFGTKTKDVTLKAAGSHSFSAWTTTSFNVDKGTSTQTRKCSRCGKIDSKTVNNAVTRFAGANRYDTAAKLSKSSYNTADTVIIADGMTFQDALIAVPLASAYNAPLLLANPNTVTTQTEAELKRLKAKKVIVVNTNGALKKPTLDALKKYNPTIISGKNCFETSKKVAEALQAKIKTNTKSKTTAPTDVFFTTNKAFADALSVSPVAALKGAPILYVDPSKKTLDSNITAYLNKVKGSVKNVYIVGGLNAIPKALENSIKSVLPKKNYKRFDGAQRYETCIMINEYFASILSSKTVCVAKGLNFPDALAGGFFAAKQKAPLILADNALKDAHKKYLKAKKPNKLYIFGGTVAVPDKLAKEIAKASV